MGITEVYTDAVHDHLPYYGNPDPGAPLDPGDYGILNGDAFERIGNLRDIGVTFSTKTEKQRSHHDFSSEGVRKTTIEASASGNAGPIAKLKAALKLDFSRERGVFFNAADCVTEGISNTDALGKQLIKRYDEGDWKKKYVVVTQVVRAGTTTVIISLKAGASVSLEATGDVQAIDLADASLRLRPVDNSSDSVYKVTSAEGMTPLMKLFRVKRSGIINTGPAQFEPALAARPGTKASAGKGLAGPKRRDLLAFDEVA